ncbi:hypothetical protein KK448_004529 [Salmonella enterica]|nr:hypothetical protein [Salmonella enterica]ECQ6334722.1 hypothetical protein [Salmonella enterica subsp. enterica serovar Abony]EEJ3293536.1 hypothetical protein [Salmonella enterica subsp. diarizonae]EDZ4567146.1 hypothetical protein [Salmonella enterica]EGB5718858.1 hypothetical protein [Salmonella enterica subsp. enterica serovar Abony]
MRMKKNDQQSRSGWGGRRKGAGAPYGNTNAVKHGERSRQALFVPFGAESLPPLVSLRAGNLLLAERYGEYLRKYPSTPNEWREFMLLDGIFWQRTRKIMALERSKVRSKSQI